MLAQLLIQFQKPIIIENALQNDTNLLTNDTSESAINRVIRSIPSVRDNIIEPDEENFVQKERFIAPNDFSNGETLN